jgi:hypothetical protein
MSSFKALIKKHFGIEIAHPDLSKNPFWLLALFSCHEG